MCLEMPSWYSVLKRSLDTFWASWGGVHVSWNAVLKRSLDGLPMCLERVLMYLEASSCVLKRSLDNFEASWEGFMCLEMPSWNSADASWHNHHPSWQKKLNLRKLPMKITTLPRLETRNPAKFPHPHRFWTNITNLFLSLTHTIGHTPTIGIPLYVLTFSSLVKSCFNFLLRNYTHLATNSVWKRSLDVYTLSIVTSRSQRYRRWNYTTGLLEHTTVLAENPVHGKHGWRSRDTIVLARPGD